MDRSHPPVPPAPFPDTPVGRRLYAGYLKILQEGRSGKLVVNYLYPGDCIMLTRRVGNVRDFQLRVDEKVISVETVLYVWTGRLPGSTKTGVLDMRYMVPDGVAGAIDSTTLHSIQIIHPVFTK